MSSVPSASVAELSGDRDWAGLWRLALDLPLAEAVAAVARINRGWRPADEPGRELLSRLAAARPRRIRAATAPPSTVQLSLRRLHGSFSCKFAPDGRAMVVSHHPAQFSRVPGMIWYELPGGRRKQGFRAVHDTVALFDGGMVFAAYGSSPKYSWFRYLPGHGSEPLGQVSPEWSNRAAAVKGGGFLIAEGARLLYGTAEPGSPLRDVTPPGLRLDGDRDKFRDVVTDPVTGRLALHVSRRGTSAQDDIVILDPDFSVVSQITIPISHRLISVDVLGFCQPDRFITLHRLGEYPDDFELKSWAVGQPAGAEAKMRVKHSYGIQPLPYARLIRNLYRYVDAETLRPAESPSAFSWLKNPPYGQAMLSLDGSYAAISASIGGPAVDLREELRVCDLVQQEFSEWAARPMAGFTADDRAAVTILRERMRGRPAEHAAVLLRDCLEYRAARWPFASV